NIGKTNSRLYEQLEHNSAGSAGLEASRNRPAEQSDSVQQCHHSAHTVGKASDGGKPKYGQQHWPAAPPAHRAWQIFSSWKLLTSILNSSASLTQYLAMNAGFSSLTS